jgi:hypothetical protein
LAGLPLAALLWVSLDWAAGVWFSALAQAHGRAHVPAVAIVIVIGVAVLLTALYLPRSTVLVASVLAFAPSLSVVLGVAGWLPERVVLGVLRMSSWPVTYVTLGVLVAGATRPRLRVRSRPGARVPPDEAR